MARPSKNRQAVGSKKRKKVRDDFFEDDDEEVEFMGSEDEGKAGQETDEEEEDVEIEETAEQKRLRLAKAYLVQLKQSGGDDNEGDSDDDGIAARLKQDALDSMGHFRRKIAHRLHLLPLPRIEDYTPTSTEIAGKFMRGHKLSVTATALTHDDRLVYSVSKNGTLIEHDIETSQRHTFNYNNASTQDTGATPSNGPEWVKPSARQSSHHSLLAAAVSSDGRYLAVGGGSKKVDIWDARIRTLIRSFPGHKDAVTALAFREGTHQLFSGSLDRSIKIWDIADMAYIDTLFGHQAEVLSIDVLRAERIVSSAADRTCRIWKIPEESQLVFRGNCPTIEDCRYINGAEWISGSADGSLQLWSNTRKKPVVSIKDAHSTSSEFGAGNIQSNNSVTAADGGTKQAGDAAASWVGSVAVCKGSDLIASGSGDGVVRLWKVSEGEGGNRKCLDAIGGVSVRGFVNSLHIAKSGKFVVAGVGQEPRMGRWLRDPLARNGVVVHRLNLDESEDEDA